MSRGPWQYASDKSVKDRVRRLKVGNPVRDQARALVEENRTLDAMYALLNNGDVTVSHVEAHERWLAQQHEDLV